LSDLRRRPHLARELVVLVRVQRGHFASLRDRSLVPEGTPCSRQLRTSRQPDGLGLVESPEGSVRFALELDRGTLTTTSPKESGELGSLL